MPADRPDLDLNNLIKRGVDLNIVRAKSQHKHRWAITGIFGVDDRSVEAMAERRLSMVNLTARGMIDEANTIDAIPVGLNDQNMVANFGPGCVKCGTHWEDPDNGHGHGCAVSDEQWQEQFNAQQQQQNETIGRIFGHLVDKARG